MRVGVEGADGVLGRAVLDRAAEHGCTAVSLSAADAPDEVEAVDVVVRASPADAWQEPLDAPSIAPAVRQRDALAAADVTVAGWWGGLGVLLAEVAMGEATAARELHVAYGLPGARRAFARASPTLRSALVRLGTDDAVARIRGEQVAEPLGEGRRLAWFPQPVGPAHAVAVGGLEQHADLPVPTVRTWFAAGSMGAELLQAVGRWDPEQGMGGWLLARAAGRGGGVGATADLRWAVVVEALDEDGSIVRSWANGTDPVLAAADLLLAGARRLVGRSAPPPSGTLLDLAPAAELLDELADLRTLRWSVSRPEPTRH